MEFEFGLIPLRAGREKIVQLMEQKNPEKPTTQPIPTVPVSVLSPKEKAVHRRFTKHSILETKRGEFVTCFPVSKSCSLLSLD